MYFFFALLLPMLYLRRKSDFLLVSQLIPPRNRSIAILFFNVQTWVHTCTKPPISLNNLILFYSQQLHLSISHVVKSENTACHVHILPNFFLCSSRSPEMIDWLIDPFAHQVFMQFRLLRHTYTNLCLIVVVYCIPTSVNDINVEGGNEIFQNPAEQLLSTFPQRIRSQRAAAERHAPIILKTCSKIKCSLLP